MATLLPDPEQQRRARLAQQPGLGVGTPQPSTGETIGRRPPINMGPADVVQPQALPRPAAVPATVTPGGVAPVAAGLGQRPPVSMGMADVVPPLQVQGPPASAPVAAGVLGRVARVGAPALGAAVEGKQIYDVATNPNTTGLDVAAQTAQGIGRLGAAGAGASAGAAAGSVLGPPGAIVGGVVGGGLGYLAADRAIAAGRSALGSDPRSPADQLPVAAAAPAAPTESGGAVFGIYPRPSSQFSTNANDAALQRGVQATGPSTFVPAAPAVVPLGVAPARLNNLTDPRSTEFQGGVGGVGAGTPPPQVPAAASGTAAGGFGAVPVAAAPASSLPLGVTRTGNGFSGANVGSPAGAGPGALGGTEDTNVRLARLQASNAAVPQGGLTVIENPGPAAAQAMFDGAALRNVVARGAPPGRNGAQVFAQQVEAAQNPIQQRAAAAALAGKEAAETQRTLIQERATQSRTAAQVAQQQEANSIDRARLGIDAIRAGQTGVPSGYRVKTDGTGLEYVPGGPADPNTPKGKNALTEDQAKSAGYAVRMENALKLIAGVGATNPGATRPGLGTALINALPESLANKVRPEDRQRVEAAQLDALDAALTLNTGAAYTKEQLQGLSRAYFAQPGDADKTVAEKQGRLNSLIDTARLRAGSSGSALADTAVQKATTASPGAVPTAPSAALPAGMSRQVGTSGGKPVYEDAQGRRFIGS